MKYFLLFDIKIIMRNYKKIPKDFKIPLQYPPPPLRRDDDLMQSHNFALNA